MCTAPITDSPVMTKNTVVGEFDRPIAGTIIQLSLCYISCELLELKEGKEEGLLKIERKLKIQSLTCLNVRGMKGLR